jgi:anti-sigma factor ChrR (cupin superfamily)
MLIHADFSRRAAVAPHQYLWVASPQTGVERVMLDRVGEEQARATSIVRYAPGARYPHHLHPGGEEILVLSGCFSDGDAHYPAGWYVRNPPGSGHQPYSAGGALIFVKLHQMPPEETRAVRIDSGDPSSWQRRDGREVCPLFSATAEQVALQRVAPGTALLTGLVRGAELLVLAGEVRTATQTYARGGWIRLPAGHHTDITAGPDGACFYLKTGHLPCTRHR